MRILILNQFYPPDAAPTGQVAHDLARCLVARGHEVTALASRRSYLGEAEYPAQDVRDGVTVQRLAGLSFGA
jgi:nucleoside-diphosphate-sugar epimerase